MVRHIIYCVDCTDRYILFLFIRHRQKSPNKLPCSGTPITDAVSVIVCVCVKDDEGKTGPFLDEIKKWFQQQKEQYIAEIKEQLGETR